MNIMYTLDVTRCNYMYLDVCSARKLRASQFLCQSIKKQDRCHQFLLNSKIISLKNLLNLDTSNLLDFFTRWLLTREK